MNDLVEIDEEGDVRDLTRLSKITLNDLIGRRIAGIYFTNVDVIRLELYEEEEDDKRKK